MFNNPYLYQNLARPSMLSRLLGASRATGGAIGAARTGINWGTLLSNTQKSLGIINQAIPIVYQVKPIINNAKTMFKIVGAVKDNPSPNKTDSIKSTKNDTTSNNNREYDNKPIFYI